MIFTDISQVKEFVGGGANMSIEMDSILPTMYLAAKQHIEPWLSKAQWTKLVDDFDAPTPTQIALLPYVQRPLALITFHEYAKIGGIQFGESGIFRVENEHQKSAYKYQENEYKDYMLLNGYETIEEMLIFLAENAEDYPLWKNSESAEKSQALFLNYATEFRMIYSQDISRYTFEILRPILEDLEYFAIRPTVGQDTLDLLRLSISNKDSSPSQRILLKFIQKALASFSIEEASKRNLVRIEGRKIIQSETLEPQGYEKVSTAKNNQLSISLRHNDEWGNRHISALKNYLETHPDEFPEYHIWQETLKAESTTETIIPETDKRIHLAGDFLTTTRKKSKGIIRL